MSEIIINPFQGLANKAQKLLKKNVFATKAINTNLRDGSLKPFPCPTLLCSHSFKPEAIFADEGCDCVAYDKPTQIEIINDFILVQECEGQAKKLTRDNFCDDISCNLGMPCPSGAPSATGDGEDCDFDPVSYMYTYVAKHGDNCVSESPPSPLSRSTTCGRATVSGFSSPPSGHCITHIRVYRISAGWKTGGEAAVENNSGALLVSEISVGQSSVSDSQSMSQSTMFSPITFDFESMPTNPSGIGVTAFSAFSWKNKELYISVDGMYDVRTKEGRFCFDHNIVMAKYWDGSIYVFTERWNYRIDEGVGSNGGVAYSNPPHRFEGIMPITSKYSVSVGNIGVVFESKSGIAILNGNDAVSVGGNLFTTDQWKAMRNPAIRTHIYQQNLFIFSKNWDHTHVFEFEDGIFPNAEYSNHVVYPYKIQAMYTTNDGDLLFASGNDTYQYAEEYCEHDGQGEPIRSICEDCCPYEYEIRPRHAFEVTDYSSAYLNIDPKYGSVLFGIYDKSCGSIEPLYEREVSGCGDNEFKLPATYLSRDHVIRLSGCATVYEMRLGTNNKRMGLNQS